MALDKEVLKYIATMRKTIEEPDLLKKHEFTRAYSDFFQSLIPDYISSENTVIKSLSEVTTIAFKEFCISVQDATVSSQYPAHSHNESVTYRELSRQNALAAIDMLQKKFELKY